jgi:hypothetical protein
MTRRTRLLAHIYIAMCGGLLAVGAALCVGIIFSSDPARGRAIEVIGPLYLALSAFYFIPGTLGGLGLLRGKQWARTLIIVLSLLVILVFPVGTALGGFGLWVLLGSDSKRYSPPLAEPTPAPLPRRPPRTRADDARYAGLFVAMAAVAAAFVVAIGTGFRVTRTPGSPISDSTYYGSIGVLVLVVVIAVKSGWLRSLRLSSPPITRRSVDYDPDGLAEQRRQADEARAQRLARLDADPVRRRYADRIRRGQWWSDEMIDYDLDPGRVATCAHLQPVERDMRAAGIDVRLRYGAIVYAWCCVDPLALAARYTLPSFVHYSEPTGGGRSYEDSPSALIACDEHESQIDVVHKRGAERDTPWFPTDIGAGSA